MQNTTRWCICQEAASTKGGRSRDAGWDWDNVAIGQPRTQKNALWVHTREQCRRHPSMCSQGAALVLEGSLRNCAQDVRWRSRPGKQTQSLQRPQSSQCEPVISAASQHRCSEQFHLSSPHAFRVRNNDADDLKKMAIRSVRRNVGAEGDDGWQQSGLFHQRDYAHLNEALGCCSRTTLDKRWW